MGSKEMALLRAVLKFVFPALTKTAIKLLEEVIQADLDKDGKVGFTGKE